MSTDKTYAQGSIEPLDQRLERLVRELLDGRDWNHRVYSIRSELRHTINAIDVARATKEHA